MTTNIPDQLRADAFTRGGAYSQAFRMIEDCQDGIVMIGDLALLEILREALQSRRTIEDLKAQHARDLAALAGDYCPGCGHRIDGHSDLGCEELIQVGPIVLKHCRCKLAHVDLQSLCRTCAKGPDQFDGVEHCRRLQSDRKASGASVDPVEDGAQGRRRKDER